MSAASDQTSDLLDAIIAEYLKAAEVGRPPDRDELLARHPELAGELSEFFDDQDRFRGLARPLGAPVKSPEFDRPHLRYFGDYELLEEIARGGMGVVYKSRQKSLNRIVAVKMILAGRLATEEDVKRFRTEAEAAANLKHPGIVAVHEVSQHYGRHYFSMDFIEGRNLSEIIRENPVPARPAAQIVNDIAEAVHYAHQQGTLHRDLKPSNILIDADGRVHVTDFGLAAKVEGDSELTRTGQILGTPSYMSPEQAAGKRGLIGPGSDVYSLGVILYEALTGRPPFRSESAVETLRQVLETEPASPRLLNASVPRDLETICLKCLEKEPHRRYPTARHLADDLERFFDGVPIEARPISRPSRLWRWCRRNPTVASLAVALILILTIVAAGSAVVAASQARLRHDAESLASDLDAALSVQKGLTARVRDEQAATEQARRLADTRAQELDQANEQLQQQADRLSTQAGELEAQAGELQTRQRALYYSLLRLSREQALGSNMALADQNLEKIPAELRGWEWRYAKRLCHPDVLTLDARRTVAISPDGTRLATWTTPHVTLRRIPDGRPLLQIEDSIADVVKLAFSPDGRFIAALNEVGTLWIWDARSGNRIQSISPGGNDLAFSADGRHAALGSGHGEVIIRETETGLVVRRWTAHERGIASVAWSADGQWVATGTARPPQFALFDAVTGKDAFRSTTLIDRTTGLEGTVSTAVNDIAFDRSGRLVAIANADIVRIFSLAERKEVGVFAGHVGGVMSVSFSPDARWLATAGTDGILRIWDIASGRNSRTLPWHAGIVTEAAFSPDGRWLASADESEVKLWDLSPDREVEIFPDHTDCVYSVCFSADGRLLASGGGRYKRGPTVGTPPAEVRVRDVETGQVVFQKDGLRSDTARFGILAVALSPDSKRVAAGGCTGWVKAWSLSNEEELMHVDVGGRNSTIANEIHSLEFTRDGNLLIGAWRRGAVVWNAETGQQIRAIPHATYAVLDRAGESFTTLLGPSPRCGISRWDLESAQELSSYRYDPPGAWRIAVSPDGSLVAMALDTRRVPLEQKNQFVRLVDARTGNVLRTLTSEMQRDYADDDYVTSVYGVAFSPDGRRLASASGDKTVRVWDVETGEELLVFPHAHQVFCVAFSPDGRRLASASGHWEGPRRGEVRIWTALPETENWDQPEQVE